MKSLLWTTDAHLDQLSDTVQDAWFEKLDKTQADMLLLGGDTANSRVFSRMLGRIEAAFPGKVALVAGNHDYRSNACPSLAGGHLCPATIKNSVGDN